MSKFQEKVDFQENWFNYEINFPCVLIAPDNMMVIVHYSINEIAYDVRGNKYILTGNTNWRRATKEELKLLKN